MKIRSKFVVVSLFGLLACGDDDGGSGGGGTGGVSSSKKIGDLSESESRALCKSLQNKFDGMAESTVDFSCTVQGALLSGGDDSKCESAVTECKKDPDSAVEDLDCDGEDGVNGGVSEDCSDVTVGELNACLDAQSKLIKDLAGKVSCSTDIAEIGELSQNVELPKACADIEAKCPDVADMASEL